MHESSTSELVEFTEPLLVSEADDVLKDTFHFLNTSPFADLTQAACEVLEKCRPIQYWDRYPEDASAQFVDFIQEVMEQMLCMHGVDNAMTRLFLEMVPAS